MAAAWGDRVSAGAASTLESHVWRLRQLLEPARGRLRAPTILISDAEGYRLIAGRSAASRSNVVWPSPHCVRTPTASRSPCTRPPVTNTPGLADVDRLIADNPGVGGIFMNTMPVKFIEPRDVSDAVLYLASDESRYVTGLSLTVDAGNTNR